ncbi:MAG: hypothetical protein IT304_06335 [Dehalococcoidia bacterium]|nr:hypothetical protein [Dehalococcoidia bacterium]
MTEAQSAYAEQAATLGRGLAFHVRRAFAWNLADTAVTEAERARLLDEGVRTDTAQRYFAWRRSALAVALVPLLITAILAIVDLADMDTAGLTGLGVLVQVGPPITLCLLPVAAAAALVRWSKLRLSQRLITGAWAAATVTPVLLALIPASWMLDDSDLSADERATTMFLAGVLLALNYAITLIPTIVSIPSGVLSGCLRVKALLPESTLPGWFLVAVAPFYSLFALVAFIVIDQIAGNALLILGLALFAFSPWLYVIFARSYIDPLTTYGDRLGLIKAQRISSLVWLGALILIVVWALTADVNGVSLVGTGDGSLLKPWDAALRVMEVFSRSLVTALVFAHVFMQFNRHSWLRARRFHGTAAAERYDGTMNELDRVLG